MMKPRYPGLRLAVLFLGLLPLGVQAEIDGYGPDAWRVVGVAPDDVLNARMGPGTPYPVIETFSHDERALQQITCVPYYTMAHFSAMSDADHDALPPRWCLMRSSDLSKAGWVAQRFLTADFDEAVDQAEDVVDFEKMLPAPTSGEHAWSSDVLIDHGRRMVAALYQYDDPVLGQSHRDPAAPDVFFSSDFVEALRSNPPGADLLTGAQDFEGRIGEPTPDPAHPMLRGMITINVNVLNFGREHTAVFRLRGDTTRHDAPLRIFRIEQDGWSFP